MNPVVHFEIPYDDADRARKFYSDAFAWNVVDWPMEDGSNYLGIQTGPVGEDGKPLEKGHIGGGMVPRSMTQHPVITLMTEGVEAAAEKAVAAGAERLETHVYANVGTLIYLKDTEGNVIALWEEAKKS